MEKLQNYIDGALVAPVKGSYIDNYNPSTGKGLFIDSRFR